MEKLKHWILGWSIVVGAYILGNLINDALIAHRLDFLPDKLPISSSLFDEFRHLGMIFIYWGIGVIVLNIIHSVVSKGK